ncbi:MAG: hypothetical protein JNL98_35050 [Bryobacterales bacterium]|nr:hypothetical protein [Bryobacterales bacterium]
MDTVLRNLKHGSGSVWHWAQVRARCKGSSSAVARCWPRLDSPPDCWLPSASAVQFEERFPGGTVNDPLVLAAALTVLALVMLAATAVPAWHASQVDPSTALRRD